MNVQRKTVIVTPAGTPTKLSPPTVAFGSYNYGNTTYPAIITFPPNATQIYYKSLNGNEVFAGLVAFGAGELIVSVDPEATVYVRAFADGFDMSNMVEADAPDIP